MPTITESTSKKKKKSDRGTKSVDNKKLLKQYALIALSGVALGLSAPGINQWYFAWLGVAPLVISIATSSGIRQAFMRGLIFGTAYNLTYANWVLGIQPLEWLGFNWWQGGLMATFAWMFVCTHQGLITALFAAVCRLIPMTGGFFPKKSSGGFQLPVLLTLPLLWVLMHHIICNAHDAMGIPWSMLEYSQYKQMPILQSASLIGGIGICYLLVMWNTALATLIAALLKIKGNKLLSVTSKEHAFYDVLFTAVIITGFIVGGFYIQSQNNVQPTTNASVLQPNINIDMQKTEHRYTLSELWSNLVILARKAPPGICVFTEGSLPTYLRSETSLQSDLTHLARQLKQDMVVGSIDQDGGGHPYNSAYGIASDGTFQSEIYHKRYLVPFGEYTPLLVTYFPEWVKRLTNTPAGGGYTAGKQPVVMSLSHGLVAPLICFETLSPELVASSVRRGGQLLVNVSDLAWFHRSICGDQMIAFSVIRAVENRRYFIFAANTGPSAIIDSNGYIQRISPLNKADVLTGKIGFNAQLTPFTRWFVF